MKRWTWIVLALLPVLAAELAAGWWMASGAVADQTVLELKPPTEGWERRREDYAEVVPSLRCSSGWIADLVDADDRPGPATRVSFFRWDATDTVNTLEAFKHLPEQCMGAIGMHLEEIHPRRVLETPGGELHFDSTRFRSGDGGRAVHIFKCVWVHGFEGADLRGGVLGGKTGHQLRGLRLAAARERFRPRHTRVIMGAVSGMPTEALAWRSFQRAIEGQLEWVTGSK